MYKTHFFFSVFCFILYTVGAQQCVVDADCNDKGVCVSSPNQVEEIGTCACDRFYIGDNCEKKWEDEHDFIPALTAFSVVATIAYSILFVVSVRQSYLIFMENNKNWKVVNTIIFFINLSSFLRILFYTVDPLNYYERTGVFGIFLFNVFTLWCLIIATLLVTYYWCKIRIKTSMEGGTSLKRIRIVFLTYLISVISILLVLTILRIATPISLFVILYNVAVTLALVIKVVFDLYNGIKLLKSLKKGQNMSSPEARGFLRKITHHLLVGGVVLVISIILAPVYATADTNNPFIYLILQAVGISVDLGYFSAVLLLTSKRKPKRTVDSTADTELSRTEK